MKKINLILLFLLVFGVGIVLGVLLLNFAEQKMMQHYDLYNCIYNNANLNSFNQNPIAIQKIQNECICFREHNYTNVSEYCK
jgi:hypothetical protein